MGSWDAIERIAVGLGVGDEALRKWRIRGVPRFWRHDLVKADEAGEINVADFDNPPGPRRAAARAAESPSEAA